MALTWLYGWLYPVPSLPTLAGGVPRRGGGPAVVAGDAPGEPGAHHRRGRRARAGGGGGRAPPLRFLRQQQELHHLGERSGATRGLPLPVERGHPRPGKAETKFSYPALPGGWSADDPALGG
eukprot:793802-Prorocentrum_minimum.AAC.4